MGGFNPVLSGMSRAFALAQILKDQALADERNQRQKERFERDKALEESDFTMAAREAGGRAPTGADRFEASSGKRTIIRNKGTVDPKTGRRVVTPNVQFEESDIKSRMIKSPGGQEFVLPTEQELQAAAAERARAEIQRKALEEDVVGRVKARNKGLGAGAEAEAKEPFAVSADRRKAATEAAGDARQAQLNRAKDLRAAEEKRLDRQSQEKRVSEQQAGAMARTKVQTQSREKVAELGRAAKAAGANVDKEVEEIDELTFEIEAVDEMLSSGETPGGETLTEGQIAAARMKQNQRLARQKQLLDIVNRKKRLAEGAGADESGTAQIKKLKGRGKKTAGGSSEGVQALRDLLR